MKARISFRHLLGRRLFAVSFLAAVASLAVLNGCDKSDDYDATPLFVGTWCGTTQDGEQPAQEVYMVFFADHTYYYYEQDANGHWQRDNNPCHFYPKGQTLNADFTDMTTGNTYHDVWQYTIRGNQLTAQVGTVAINMTRVSAPPVVSLPALPGLEMVSVPAGTFWMGAQTTDPSAPGYDPSAHSTEGPVRQVSVDAFQLATLEVSQALWENIFFANPSAHQGDNRCPVEMVSWNQIQTFLERLKLITGKDYKLPTETQWEYAAKGGPAGASSPFLYSGSNDVDLVAWYGANSQEQTHPGGTKEPNALGLYDMSGNVWEWCANVSPADAEARALRGGSWFYNAWCCRCTHVNYGNPANSNRYLGFRLCL